MGAYGAEHALHQALVCRVLLWPGMPVLVLVVAQAELLQSPVRFGLA
jgi:hypothetical protein